MHWAAASQILVERVVANVDGSGALVVQNSRRSKGKPVHSRIFDSEGRRNTTALGVAGYFAPPATSMGRALARKARPTPPLALLSTLR